MCVASETWQSIALGSTQKLTAIYTVKKSLMVPGPSAFRSRLVCRGGGGGGGGDDGDGLLLI